MSAEIAPSPIVPLPDQLALPFPELPDQDGGLQPRPADPHRSVQPANSLLHAQAPHTQAQNASRR